MSGSDSERAVRSYAASRLREMMPQARIIHELVVGGCRADLAAIEPQRVTLVEIKSEKDTLTRLARQVQHFAQAAHQVIVIAHERWFCTEPYNDGRDRFVPSEALACGVDHRGEIWAYPENADRRMFGRWDLRRYWHDRPEPRASDLLYLLWKQELLAEAARHGVNAATRSRVPTIVRDMAWLMTGREIAEAVCRQLRQRSFPEADPPIAATPP